MTSDEYVYLAVALQVFSAKTDLEAKRLLDATNIGIQTTLLLLERHKHHHLAYRVLRHPKFSLSSHLVDPHKFSPQSTTAFDWLLHHAHYSAEWLFSVSKCIQRAKVEDFFVSSEPRNSQFPGSAFYFTLFDPSVYEEWRKSCWQRLMSLATSRQWILLHKEVTKCYSLIIPRIKQWTCELKRFRAFLSFYHLCQRLDNSFTHVTGCLKNTFPQELVELVNQYLELPASKSTSLSLTLHPHLETLAREAPKCDQCDAYCRVVEVETDVPFQISVRTVGGKAKFARDFITVLLPRVVGDVDKSFIVNAEEPPAKKAKLLHV
jgi:hypothetical protein